MDETICAEIRSASQELANRLRNRESLENIEIYLSNQLLKNIDWSFFVSGRNRYSQTTANVIKRAKRGQYVVILNVMDGGVNYARGGRFFSASISILDKIRNSRYAVVYDGFDDRILEFSNYRHCWDNKCAVSKVTRPILGLWRLVPLDSSRLKQLPEFSLRSLGSTSLSILEVLAGRMDIYVSRTKLWNFHWAIGLCENGSLSLTIGAEDEPAVALEDHLFKHPEKSVLLVCYRKERYFRELAAVIESFKQYYG